MDDLIKALQILLKYGNPSHPTDCQHDILRVYIENENVSDEDVKELESLGFNKDEEFGCFYSYRFGSC